MPKKPTERVLISMPPDLLEIVDSAARADFASRSEFIRKAVLNQLRSISPERIYTLKD